jgi:hypoxanthine phosphoribosyltransferase
LLTPFHECIKVESRCLILARGAASVMTAVLLEKPGHLAANIKANFRGFLCPDKFVVGYGMDMAHQFRELPFVGHVLSAA